MKSLFLRVATVPLFLVGTLLGASICLSQTLESEQALQVLADNGLEEVRPGIWSLKGSQGNNFAIRKLRRLQSAREIITALHVVGGKLDIPEGSDTHPDFDSTIEPPPEDSAPPATKKEPQPEAGSNSRPASIPKPEVRKIPSKEDRKQALEVIQEAFEIEYAAATTPEKQKDLAKVLSEFIHGS